MSYANPSQVTSSTVEAEIQCGSHAKFCPDKVTHPKHPSSL